MASGSAPSNRDVNRPLTDDELWEWASSINEKAAKPPDPDKLTRVRRLQYLLRGMSPKETM